ncbi:MAG: DnaA regulatory inactivator Hda [Gammaproteobacteria bacterium]
MVQQLLPGVQLSDTADFPSFLAADNIELVQLLQQIPTAARNEPNVFISAAAGSGKTHLLQASCRQAQQAGWSAFYLPLEIIDTMEPEVLNGLENFQLVCLDDVETIAGSQDWEEALFHCFNRLQSSGSMLIVSSHEAPAQLPIQLADLKSRLEWGLLYHIKTLTDQQRIQALQLRAHLRGFKLPEKTANFLLTRMPRDMATLFEMLDTLDTASLSEQRKLSIPFVREVLAGGVGP